MAFRVLPRALRPTRVWRLAEPLLEGVKDPEFEVLLRRIDAAPIHRGRRTLLHELGDACARALSPAL
jgi:hypothetical protein